jgi:insulin receptor
LSSDVLFNLAFEPAEIKSKPETPKVVEPAKTPEIFRSCDCLTCAQTCSKKEKDDDEHRQLAIDFEDEIQDFVYVRQDTAEMSPPQNRAKRQVLEFPDGNKQIEPETTKLKGTSEKDPLESKRDNVTNDYIYFYKVINDTTQTSFELHDLTHYTSYQIIIKACREKSERNKTDPHEEKDEKDKEDQDECGPEAIITEITQKKDENDDITDLEATRISSNSSLGSIKITWKEPVRPNGAILSYTIRYRKNDIENTKHENLCITQKQFKNQSNQFILDKLPNGNYTIQVAANSMAGMGNYSTARPIVINFKETNFIWYLFFIVFTVFCVLLLFVCIYLRRYYSASMSASMKLIASVNPDYHGVHYKQDSYEVPREKVIQLHELGQGSFGMVYEGIIRDVMVEGSRNIDEMRCAIKTVNENATDKERISFLNEASIMKQFDTAFVVKLLGVVSQGQPTFVIMELMVSSKNILLSLFKKFLYSGERRS